MTQTPGKKFVSRHGGRDGIHVAKVALAHGGGGKAMRDLIDDVFVSVFDNPDLCVTEDQARFDLASLAKLGNRLAFTSDSFVVDPLIFPGGDIGRLAVCGTVNDLAVGGAKPLYLSCSVIIEEGLDVDLLRRLAGSMAETAAEAGVAIVTGDTKVVPHGACDKLFINTAGIGIISQARDLGLHRVAADDAILVTGFLGDHGAAILSARGDLRLATPLESDCAPLNGLVEALLAACPEVSFMRDPTRGGLASVLNEITEAGGFDIELNETSLPLREAVRGFCEILGLDPLYLANEGKLVVLVPGPLVDKALTALKAHPLGIEARLIGHVREANGLQGSPGRVVMRTQFGGRRIVDMLVGEQLPRIC